MPITVRELLSIPRLQLQLLVEGDLDRTIRWVHSSEMPDPSAYLRGDEIVLSAGIWLWGGSSSRGFAHGLAQGGAAGIGFGPSALVTAVPQELIDACVRERLTLFAVPDTVPFIAIIETFVERYVEDRERALLDASRRNQELVEAAQRGQGVRGVLRTLARHHPGRAWVIDRRRGLLGWTDTKPSAGLVASVADSLERQSPIAAPADWSLIPIVSSGADAYLAIEGELDEMPVADRTAIEQAVAFLAIELQRDLAVRESERRFAAELVDLINAGEAQLPAARARLQAFGLDPDAPLATVVSEVPEPENGLAVTERLLDALNLRGVVAVKGLRIVTVICDPRAHDLTELARSVRAALGSRTAVGIGGQSRGVQQLRRSLIEAQQACRFASTSTTGYASHSEVGSHALLLALQDDAVLDAFRDTVLGPLAEHDARRHTDLVRTLTVFLESGGAYQVTADMLTIHVNTLRLRLARIETLTGRSLADMESRVDFFIALRSRSVHPRPG